MAQLNCSRLTIALGVQLSDLDMIQYTDLLDGPELEVELNAALLGELKKTKMAEVMHYGSSYGC